LSSPARCSKLGDRSQVVTLGMNMVARLNDPQVRWSPYVAGGVGTNIMTGDQGESIYRFRPNRGGFQGGAGFEFRLRSATTFVEGRYFGLPPGGLAVWNFGFRY
jgi:hypothetical protein